MSISQVILLKSTIIEPTGRKDLTTQTPQANIATFQADAASAVIKAIKYNKRINKNR
jgi:hypothetical protein